MLGLRAGFLVLLLAALGFACSLPLSENLRPVSRFIQHLDLLGGSPQRNCLVLFVIVEKHVFHAQAVETNDGAVVVAVIQRPVNAQTGALGLFPQACHVGASPAGEVRCHHLMDQAFAVLTLGLTLQAGLAVSTGLAPLRGRDACRLLHGRAVTRPRLAQELSLLFHCQCRIILLPPAHLQRKLGLRQGLFEVLLVVTIDPSRIKNLVFVLLERQHVALGDPRRVFLLTKEDDEAGLLWPPCESLAWRPGELSAVRYKPCRGLHIVLHMVLSSRR